MRAQEASVRSEGRLWPNAWQAPAPVSRCGQHPPNANLTHPIVSSLVLACSLFFLSSRTSALEKAEARIAAAQLQGEQLQQPPQPPQPQRPTTTDSSK